MDCIVVIFAVQCTLLECNVYCVLSTNFTTLCTVSNVYGEYVIYIVEDRVKSLGWRDCVTGGSKFAPHALRRTPLGQDANSQMSILAVMRILVMKVMMKMKMMILVKMMVMTMNVEKVLL